MDDENGIYKYALNGKWDREGFNLNACDEMQQKQKAVEKTTWSLWILWTEYPQRHFGQIMLMQYQGFMIIKNAYGGWENNVIPLNFVKCCMHKGIHIIFKQQFC